MKMKRRWGEETGPGVGKRFHETKRLNTTKRRKGKPK